MDPSAAPSPCQRTAAKWTRGYRPQAGTAIPAGTARSGRPGGALRLAYGQGGTGEPATTLPPPAGDRERRPAPGGGRPEAANGSGTGAARGNRGPIAARCG